MAPPPHWFRSRVDGLLARVGDTPLVRLSRVLPDDISPDVEVWAKLEWFNPGGSVKDRAALSMVLDAEERGLLRPGMTILDASSGNTGIAYAMIASARGYRLTLCLPKNANAERKAVLRAYGATIVETDPLEGSDGAIRVARQLAAEQPDRFVYLNQYDNDANWLAHFHTTGPEIWRDTGGRITHWVASLGTSGTFTGTSRFLKTQDPGIVVTSVQPDSPFHGLEGLKYMATSIVPGIYDPTLADRTLEAPTEESLDLVRRLAAEEGLLAGVSSGAQLWAAIETARGLERGVVVTLFPDSGERYLSEGHVFPGTQG
ncbi:MAG: cysteine synthase family protein [Alphaproteobacteria bacterium]|nr:cysteine synthase family protein [Alphaproteobacteria bacterium]